MNLTKGKVYSIIGFFLSLLLIFCFYSTLLKANQKVVVVNPGHSMGYDSGATSQYKSEAQVNQELAGRLVRILNQRGYKVYITHTQDAELASQKLLSQSDGSYLKNVGKATNSVNPDLAISIHHNSGGSTASGYELYWSSYRDFDTEGVYQKAGLWSSGEKALLDSSPCLAATESQKFAQIIKNSLDGQPRIGFRKIVERNDYLPAHATCPCVLYEGGFLSNPSEAQYLASDAYQQEAATRLANAIDTYFGQSNFVKGESGSSTTGGVPISGNAGVNADQLAVFYKNRAGIEFPAYYQARGVSLQQFCQMYVDECTDEGIRADVAFAQAMLETAYLKFGGDVNISQFNFAGIGATGGVPGYDFAAQYGDNSFGIRMGIRGHVQHLKAYANTNALVNACVDPRFNLVKRGSAPYVTDLSGKWATGSNYGSSIVSLMTYIPGSNTTPVQSSQSSNTTSSSTGSSNTGSTSSSAGSSFTTVNGPAGTTTVYRLFNKVNGEHLYTPDAYEAQVLSSGNVWKYEGVGWYAPQSGDPVYRLFNPVQGNHLYTTDQNEVKVLTTTSAWIMDNDGKPLFYSGGNIPIYRLYNQGQSGLHHLTTDSNEYQVLPSKGWKQEGVSLKASYGG